MVTFLFTDIEGSTKLAQENPERFPYALKMHNEILHEAVKSHNGLVFKIIGDAFCCSFDKAEDAVKAACEIQTKLNETVWNDSALKCRIGIHTGNAVRTSDGYEGYITLARVQRIMSAGYGGQILASYDTFRSLPAVKSRGISYKDLGERRLKDMVQPVKLFQVVYGNLRSDFPQLKTLDAHPNNLPLQLTSFIGRLDEMKYIMESLKKSSLVTLTGTGGSGKTRLSIQAAADVVDEYANGVWFVELASIDNPEFIVQEIASTLNLTADGGRDLIEVVKDFLREKELLLIMDNCEHLIEGCAQILTLLLNHCKDLRILATSRESLHIPGEVTFIVPPLSLPEKNELLSAAKASDFEALRLFIERAQSLKNDFEVNDLNIKSIAELCRQLDGIPLAIELASARIRVLTVEKILEKIHERFRLLRNESRSANPRQQTLLALIDWSYDLLSEKEKLMLQRLSVFADGCTLDAVEQICCDEVIEDFEALDLLSNLIDKSLLIMNEKNGTGRYSMLETIHEYAMDKLGNDETTFLKYCDYLYKLAKDCNAKRKKDFTEGFDILEAENDNYRYAINHSLTVKPEKSLDLLSEIISFWEYRGNYREGVQSALEVIGANKDGNKKLIADVYSSASMFALLTGDYENAETFAKGGIEIFQELNDKEGEANILNSFGLLNYRTLKMEKAEAYYRESLKICKENNFRYSMGTSLVNCGTVCQAKGDYDEAYDFYEQGCNLFKEYNDKRSISRALTNMATIDYYKGNYMSAVKKYDECLAIFREINDSDAICVVLFNTGNAYLSLKQFSEAEKYYEECRQISKNLGYKNLIIRSTIRLGDIALANKDFLKAEKTYKECLPGCNELEDVQNLANCFRGLGHVSAAFDSPELSVKLLSAATSLFKKSGFQLPKQRAEEIENVLNSLKSKLGKKKFEELWVLGCSESIQSLKLVLSS